MRGAWKTGRKADPPAECADGLGPLMEKCPAQKGRFSQIAEAITHWAGSAWAFNGAIGVILLWLVMGPVCGYSDTWQLTVNTGTSVVTFLMVFLIQRTQNRDTRAVHLKLNELIAAVEGASSRLINAEELDDQTLTTISHQFHSLAQAVQSQGKAARASSVEEVPLPEAEMTAADAPPI